MALNIVKFDTTLNKTSIATTLTGDRICLDGFQVGDYIYMLIQSATDNNTSMLRFNTITEAYDILVLTAIAYNTATKFVKEVTSAGNYAHIFTSTGKHYRINLESFASAVAVKRNSTVDVGGVITITDDFVSAEDSLIFTTGFGDNPQGK